MISCLSLSATVTNTLPLAGSWTDDAANPLYKALAKLRSQERWRARVGMLTVGGLAPLAATMTTVDIFFKPPILGHLVPALAAAAHPLAVASLPVLASSAFLAGMFDLVEVLTDRTDAVVVNPPVYSPFFAYTRHRGRRVVEAPLGVDLRLDFDQLEHAFSSGGDISPEEEQLVKDVAAIAYAGRILSLVCEKRN